MSIVRLDHRSFWVARWISSLITDKVPYPTTVNRASPGYPRPRHSILCTTESTISRLSSPSSFSLSLSPPIFRHFFFFLFPFLFFLYHSVRAARIPGRLSSCPLSLSLSLCVPLFFFEALRCGEGKFTREEGGARARIYIYIYVCVRLYVCVLEEGWGGKRRNRRRAVRWINSRFAEGLSFEIPSAILFPPPPPASDSPVSAGSIYSSSGRSCESITAGNRYSFG